MNGSCQKTHAPERGRAAPPIASVLIFIFVAALLPAAASAADVSTFTSSGCSFPDTGDPASVTTTFGEDDDYKPSAGKRRFTIYAVGTASVTVDDVTGLSWVTNPNDSGTSGTYTWAGALSACENLSYAGLSDWRLPNLRELLTIVDYAPAAAPAINTVYFLNTSSNRYWVSTTDVSWTACAWVVSFSDAVMYRNILKTDSYYVRCVRGGP